MGPPQGERAPRVGPIGIVILRFGNVRLPESGEIALPPRDCVYTGPAILRIKDVPSANF